MPRHFLQAPRKIPVLIPDSRESGRESGSLRTAPTASKSARNSYPLLLPAKLVKIPIKSGYWAKLCSPEKLRGTGFLGHPWSILSSRRVCAGWGRQGPRPRRPGQSGRRRHPRRSQNPAQGGFCSNFFGVVGPCFCWGFWRKRVVGRG
jgi:hypothetical protein